MSPPQEHVRVYSNVAADCPHSLDARLDAIAHAATGGQSPVVAAVSPLPPSLCHVTSRSRTCQRRTELLRAKRATLTQYRPGTRATSAIQLIALPPGTTSTRSSVISSISSMISSPALTTPPAIGTTAAATRAPAWLATVSASRSSDSRIACSASSRARSRARMVSASSTRAHPPPLPIEPSLGTNQNEDQQDSDGDPSCCEHQRRAPTGKRRRESAHGSPVRKDKGREEGGSNSQGDRHVPRCSAQFRAMVGSTELRFTEHEPARITPDLLDQLGHRLWGSSVGCFELAVLRRSCVLVDFSLLDRVHADHLPLSGACVEPGSERS